MSASAKHRHYSDIKATTQGSLIAKVPIVLFSMILSGLLFLTVFSYAALSNSSPVTLSAPLSLLALYLSSFVGGCISSKTLLQPDSYLCALLSSLIFTVTLLVLKMIVPQPDSVLQTGNSIILHSLIVIVGLAGTYFAERSKSRKFRRHKKRR